MRRASEEGKALVVIYAAKSTEDVRLSIPAQVADCEAMARREGLEVAAVYVDEAKSAYHADRGDGLAQAQAHAERLVAEGFDVNLYTQHSDRLARGDGVHAQHLVEVLLWALKAGIVIRSVHDPQTVDSPVMAAMMGERNHEDSKRKAQAITDGLRRMDERGEPKGSLAGYRMLYTHDEQGRVTGRRREFDPDRRPVYDLIFHRALEGWSDRQIALELERHGYLTAPNRRGYEPQPFDGHRIGKTLKKAAYAALIVRNGEVVGEGNRPPFVSVEDFERIQRERRRRNGDRKAGRPPEGYTLAGVAACGICGGPMDCVTTPRVRADGTRARAYVCRAHRNFNEGQAVRCAAAPLDAEPIDDCFASNLDRFLGDVSLWGERVTRSRIAERDRIAGDVERAKGARVDASAAVERRQAAYDAKLAEGDPEQVEAVLEGLTARRADLKRADDRLRAAERALTDATAEQGQNAIDLVLDFYSGLKAEIAGRVENARGDVRGLNEVVRSTFSEVVLTATEFGVEIEPVMSMAAAERIVENPSYWAHYPVSPGELFYLADSGLPVGAVTVPPDEADRPVIEPPPLRTLRAERIRLHS